MAKIGKPSTKKIDNLEQTSTNLNKETSTGNIVAMNFKVEEAFRDRFKRRALDDKKSMTDILHEAFALYEKQNG